jgi:hypothetical protein
VLVVVNISQELTDFALTEMPLFQLPTSQPALQQARHDTA